MALDREAFQNLLMQGGELLSTGELEQARGVLEQAYALQPKNEKALNLLGLTYFKMGSLEQAADIYEALVRENPVDPTLRVNLGLVYLKSNALDRAVREFETATDLAPEHKKAQNYLGLALAQAGDFGRAREHFALAGSDAMVEKMDRALQEGARAPETVRLAETPAAPPQEEAAPPADGEWDQQTTGELYVGANAAPVPEAAGWEAPVDAGEAAPAQEDWAGLGEGGAEGEAPLAPPPLESDWGAQFGFDPATAPAPENPFEAPPVTPEEEMRFAEDEGPSTFPAPAPKVAPPQVDVALEVAAISNEPIVLQESMVEPPPPEANAWMSERPQPAVRVVGPAGEAAPLGELAASARLDAPGDEATFVVKPDVVVLTVREELFARCDELLAMRGGLSFQPLARRYRGRPLETPFGEGGRQLQRVTGQGTLLVATGRRTFVPVTLGEHAGYFLEEVVYAFEEGLTYENGTLPTGTGEEVHLVHLSGEGQALLKLDGPLRSVEVQGTTPVTVPLRHWVGWFGALSPRLVTLPGPGGATNVGVELAGEGFALLAAVHG